MPFRELIPVPEKSLPTEGQSPSLDDNLIIHGDNLEALKALLPRYAGKVDVIYIDPPYNTGNEGWAYNDNVNSPLMKQWFRKVVDAEDLERHDKWLCMMWPRLQLLFELLAEGGVIFISCDDIEVHHLRTILNEIAGEDAFVAQFVWKSRTSEDTRAKSRVSVDHEYIITFGANGNGVLRGVEKDESKFSNPDNDSRGPWRSADMTGLAPRERRPNLHYDLVNPETDFNYGCPPKGWRFEKPTMDKKILEKRILWPAEPTGRPRHKLFQKEIRSKFKNISSVMPAIGTESGTRETDLLLGPGFFDFPKPSSLVRTLIQQAADSNAVVLDAFAGSGVTGQAVLAQNAADGGNRRFILIQLPEQLNESSPAYSAGYREIAELTSLRIKRTISGVDDAEDEALRNGLGGSFTYCELGDPIDLDRFFDGEATPPYAQVARYIAYTATGQSIEGVPDAPDDLWFVGEAGGYRIHLIYRPDLAWMKSDDAALTADLADRMAEAAGKQPILVYAAQKFISQKALLPKGVTFCQLPYSIYRILGDGSDAA